MNYSHSTQRLTDRYNVVTVAVQSTKSYIMNLCDLNVLVSPDNQQTSILNKDIRGERGHDHVLLKEQICKVFGRDMHSECFLVILQ